jgi:hypothetical protein
MQTLQIKFSWTQKMLIGTYCEGLEIHYQQYVYSKYFHVYECDYTWGFD